MATRSISGDAGKLPLDCATALLTGMTTDTNNFANSVYPSTLAMTSALLQRGVDRDAVLDLLYNRHSESRLRLMGHMMKDLLTITDDGVAYIVLDRHTQMKYAVAEGDTEGFVNMPLSIEKVRMSILAKEDGGRIRISIRSKKGTSANRCAREHFNGGGHENAAGGRLYMPENVSSTDEIGKYIEKHTHEFLTEKDEDNK
jgi:phosphoesterase RecJ-like protein